MLSAISYKIPLTIAVWKDIIVMAPFHLKKSWVCMRYVCMWMYTLSEHGRSKQNLANYSPLAKSGSLLVWFLLLLLLFYLFLAALGLHCCAQAFSSCSKWGLLFAVVHGLLIAVASRCRAQVLGAQASVVVARGRSSCGLRALEHRLSNCGARA